MLRSQPDKHLAAYGDADKFLSQMRKLVHSKEDGEIEMDLSYFDYFFFDRAGSFTPKMSKLLGPPRQKGEEITQRHFDIAAATQAFFEILMDHSLAFLHSVTGSRNVCISGGTAMNCVYNGKITERTAFKRAHMAFAPDDSGNSIGAALALANRMGLEIRCQGLSSALGPQFSDDELGATLEKFKIKARKSHAVAADAARLIADGKVIAWFQGRAEFGQRALGHRSILASPLNASMKDKINRAVKYRESYRPFAPAILEERTAEFFKTSDPDPVLYMEKAFPFRPECRSRVPAVVHNDGTGRLQTVNRQSEPLYAEAIAQFEKLTGVPIIVNTSFNRNGEPIVCAPEDAIRTFYSSGLDVLVLGPYVIEK